MKFKEDFIQYLWKHQLLKVHDLKLLDDTPIYIHNQGQHNYFSGPDFKNAQVSINQTKWYGNIEIHVKSSDWYQHQHDTDPNYDNVILHVVYENDLPMSDPLITKIPHLELKGLIPLKYWRAFESHMTTDAAFPCHSQLDNVKDIDKNMWLHRMSIERLESKNIEIQHLLIEYKNDWEQVATIVIGRYFGMRKNNDNFELLLKSLPVSLIRKNKDSLFKIESLLFGLSGMLSQTMEDEYPKDLLKEYHYQMNKYDLKEELSYNWNFMRMRPANFPTIRISQLSQLLTNNNGLMSNLLRLEILEDLESFFQISATEYWNSHYVFDKESKSNSTKKAGKSLIKNLILNAVIPLIFSYAKTKNKMNLTERSLDFLDQLGPEKNSIVSKWATAGFKAKSAGDSLGLVHLNENYCQKYKCLECTIGHKLISNN